MQRSPPAQPVASASSSATPPSWDAFLLVLLVCAVLMVTGLAESAALLLRLQDVLRHPLLGNLLPAAGEAAMGQRGPIPGEPLGLTLNALTLAQLIGYLLVDRAAAGHWRRRLKWLLLAGIILTAVYLPAGKMIALRQGSGPASYTHDGGVIQTEATIQFLLQGKNPYAEDYTQTPMAEWGFDEFRTALYHYPYLPWTFLFSAPFYLLGQAFGFYDQRLVYLLLMAVALALVPQLAQEERARFALVATLGLNPIMALDLIFGQNDSFVLCWVIFGLLCWQQWRTRQRMGIVGRGWWLAATILFGLACASKPTAWFFAPFFGLLLLSNEASSQAAGWGKIGRAIPAILRRLWPTIVVVLVILLPYILWNPFAFYDDVWRWSNGRGETGYQIWGWGLSNFVLALGLVKDRFQQWPFWVTEVLLALPVLLWFIRRQLQQNTLANGCWHYAIFLFVFFYSSRFLNENYLGYLLAFLALGTFSSTEQ